MPYQEGFSFHYLWNHDCVRPFFPLIALERSYLYSVGITLAFTIPRVPGLNINTITPLQAATGSFNSSVPIEFSRSPANFSFPAFASIQVDTGSNYLPLTITHMTASVYDMTTGYLVATSELSHQTFPAKTFSNLNLPLNFTYVAVNDSDTTCEWARASLPIYLFTNAYTLLDRDELVRRMQEQSPHHRRCPSR